MENFKSKKSDTDQNNIYIQLVFPGPIGGLEKVLFNGLKQLQKQNVRSPIWVVREKRVPRVAEEFILELENLALEHKIFDCQGKFDFNLLRNLKKEIKSTRPRIVHAHGVKAVFYAKLITTENIKFVMTHHGVTAHTMQIRLYEWLERKMMKKANRVIAVSRFMKDQIKKHKINPEKISVVENLLSIDESLIERAPKVDNKLLYVGRLSPEKACGNMIRAVKDLDVTVDIVGDGTEKNELIRLTKELKIQKKIKFHGFQRNIHKFLNECSFLVMPSLTEGFPLTAIEAACFGVPIIASEVGALSEVVGKNGKLVEAGNVFALMKAIETLTKNFDHFNSNAQEMSLSFLKDYSAESWANKTISIYNELIS